MFTLSNITCNYLMPYQMSRLESVSVCMYVWCCDAHCHVVLHSTVVVRDNGWELFHGRSQAIVQYCNIWDQKSVGPY